MAGEIQVQWFMRTTKGSYSDQSRGSFVADQVGSGGGNPGVIDVSTSGQLIDAGDISSTKGIGSIQNLDDTNYVDVGPECNGSISPTIRVLPGESWPLRFVPDVSLMIRANAAPCRVLVSINDA